MKPVPPAGTSSGVPSPRKKGASASSLAKLMSNAKKVKEKARSKELKALPGGFNLKLHDWRADHWCASVTPGAVKELMQHYTPGDHWLHVQRQLPKEDALEMGPEAEAWVRSSLLSLLPVYHTILWDPS